MSASEADWLGLYNRLHDVLGEEHASTLVNNLVTKADIAGLATKADLAELKADLFKWTVGSMVALTGIFSAVVVIVVTVVG